jgi:hypothetical protein
MLNALEQRALAGASTVAAAQGLKVDAAVVISREAIVLVHLRPAPVVARVMSGTVALHDDPRGSLEREVSVLEFLMPSRLAVSPSRLIAPGPHYHDGLWMTFMWFFYGPLADGGRGCEDDSQRRGGLGDHRDVPVL